MVVLFYEVVEVGLEFELALAVAKVVIWELGLILIHLDGK